MAAYQEHGSSKPESEEALLAKFHKKINKSAQLKVAKDRVKLLQPTDENHVPVNEVPLTNCAM